MRMAFPEMDLGGAIRNERKDRAELKFVDNRRPFLDAQEAKKVSERTVV